jgi:hypothetical protein
MNDLEVSLVLHSTVPVIWAIEAVNSDGEGHSSNPHTAPVRQWIAAATPKLPPQHSRFTAPSSDCMRAERPAQAVI